MIDRKDLKTKAKAILKKKYIYLLLVAILFSFCAINFYASVSVTNAGVNYEIYYRANIGIFNFYFDPTNVNIISLLVIITLLVRVFLTYPMEYSTSNYYKRARVDTEKGTLANGYKNGNLKKCIFTFVHRDLMIFLWALLLIVPGIIKAYEYRLVPYLLEDYPDKTSSELLQLSKKMMYGNKKNAFVLDLSFFGWYLLAAVASFFTFGIAGYFLLPYVNQTNAELYVFLEETYKASNDVLDIEPN